MCRQFQRVGYDLFRRAGINILDATGGIHRFWEDLDLDLREVMDAALYVEQVDAGIDAVEYK
jgi:hypothetical protein